MRLLLIGGDHPRHRFVLNAVSQTFPPVASIIETRENMTPAPPDGIPKHDQANFVRHFRDRNDAEERYFGDAPLPPGPRLMIHEDELSDQPTADFVAEQAPDLAFIFGSGLIKGALYSVLPSTTINLHLGLSPRYRGAAGLFWPFYFLEPACVGVTFHHIVAEPDAGDVIHQVVPQLMATDGIHDVACKSVLAATDDAIKLFEIVNKGGSWKSHRQRATGKNFPSSDFQAHHLRLIYDLFDNDIVGQYLAGRIAAKTPKLVRQF